MASKQHQQAELVDALKGSRRLDWNEYIDRRQAELEVFKKQYGNADDTDKKFFAKHETKIREETEYVRGWCVALFPEEKGYVTVDRFDITILITPR